MSLPSSERAIHSVYVSTLFVSVMLHFVLEGRSLVLIVEVPDHFFFTFYLPRWILYKMYNYLL